MRLPVNAMQCISVYSCTLMLQLVVTHSIFLGLDIFKSTSCALAKLALVLLVLDDTGFKVLQTSAPPAKQFNCLPCGQLSSDLFLRLNGGPGVCESQILNPLQ